MVGKAVGSKKGNNLLVQCINNNGGIDFSVPVILVSEKNKKVRLKKGKSLTSIAPTVLKLMDIEIPSTYDEPLF